MSTRKKVVSVFIYIAVLVLLCAGCFCVITQPLKDKIFCAVGILASLSLIPYIFGGFTKKRSVWYRIYMVLCAGMSVYAALADVLGSDLYALSPGQGITTFVFFLIFAHFLLFGIAENLKRAITYSLCGVDLAAVVAITVFASEEGSIVRNLITVLVLVLTFLLIAEKYIDKKERNSNHI